MADSIRMLLQLTKVRIAILATASAVTGYILAAHGISVHAIAPMAGVFLLACGAGALNQCQEVEIDSMMERTKSRPLPTGRMQLRQALAVSILLIVAGAMLLAASPQAVALGLLTIFWYNGVYTYLKRVSAFAAIPGGLVGAIPPVIGWVSAGGSISDPGIVAVAFFFFVWQVPHFWLLLLRIGDDYRRAGLPTLTTLLSRRQLTRVIFVWMMATSVSCIIIPLFGVSPLLWVQIGLLAASVWLGWHATVMLRTDGATLAFKQINVYALVVISMLSLSGLLA